MGPRAPRWSFWKPLAWPPFTSGESKSRQALDVGIQNLTSLGSHPLSKESSDFGTSHLQIRVQDGRGKYLHVGELEFRAKSSSHETTPTWTCHSADAQACVIHSLSLSLSFPTGKVSNNRSGGHVDRRVIWCRLVFGTLALAPALLTTGFPQSPWTYGFLT